MGLGDSLYLQSVARHFVSKGYEVEACSKWHDVFRPLAPHVHVSPFRRDRISHVAHYSARRPVRGTTQFEDILITAGIKEQVDLYLDWSIVNKALIEDLIARAGKRPIVLVQLPRPPMDRTDGIGAELLPDCKHIQQVIDHIGDRAFFIQVGRGKRLFDFRVDLDLAEQTSVSDLLDIASYADGFLGYVSYFVPLAEGFATPALFVWSSRGLKARNEMVRSVTPEKVLHRKDICRAIADDCQDDLLHQAADSFLAAARDCALV